MVQILVNFFCFLLPTKFARTTNMKIACDPEAEVGSHRCCPSTNIQNLWGGAQLFPRHMTCPRSHELLVSSQTNYLPSSLSTRILLSSCASSITTHIHKSSQALNHGNACLTVSRQPWNQLDAVVKTRWWSLFTFPDSFMFNIKTQ